MPHSSRSPSATSLFGPSSAPSSDALANCERVLARFFESARERAVALSPLYVELWTEIERATTGGKRLRPALVDLTFRAYPDATGESAVSAETVASVGAAFELLHTALIVHDDVIDRDVIRRHQDTLHVAARGRAQSAGAAPDRAEHYGTSVGVVAGDLALSGAHRLVATSGLPAGHLLDVLELLDEAVFASGAGELLDIHHALPGIRPTAEEVLKSTRLKTSVYSFEAPLQAGALLAGAPASDVESLGNVGRHLGLAFQLADDLLGVFGCADTTGKATNADLLEGKFTPLIMEALNTPEGPEVLALLAGQDGREGQDEHERQAGREGQDGAAQRVTRLRELLTTSGARTRVENSARKAADDAAHTAREGGLPPGLVDEIAHLAVGSVERLR